MNRAFEKVAEVGIVPVISLNDPQDAVSLAGALCEGGLPVMEITLRTTDALRCIRSVRKAYPDMILSAGTVLSSAQVDEAVAAGADYVVSPGYNPQTAEYCRTHGVEIIPGCVTAYEIDAAMAAGLQILKFFPAEQSGGVEAIKLLSGPFDKVRFLPTGGIGFDNLSKYLACGNVIACGGSFMAKSNLIAARKWDEITQNVRRSLDLSLDFELAHVGVNGGDSQEAEKAAARLGALLRMPLRYGSKSVFAGTAVECMQKPIAGKNGHIGFWCNSCERAIAWFSRCGVSVLEDTAQPDTHGSIKFVYLDEEILGFAIHIIKR